MFGVLAMQWCNLQRCALRFAVNRVIESWPRDTKRPLREMFGFGMKMNTYAHRPMVVVGSDDVVETRCVGQHMHGM